MNIKQLLWEILRHYITTFDDVEGIFETVDVFENNHDAERLLSFIRTGYDIPNTALALVESTVKNYVSGNESKRERPAKRMLIAELIDDSASISNALLILSALWATWIGEGVYSYTNISAHISKQTPKSALAHGRFYLSGDDIDIDAVIQSFSKSRYSDKVSDFGFYFINT